MDGNQSAHKHSPFKNMVGLILHLVKFFFQDYDAIIRQGWIHDFLIGGSNLQRWFVLLISSDSLNIFTWFFWGKNTMKMTKFCFKGRFEQTSGSTKDL